MTTSIADMRRVFVNSSIWISLMNSDAFSIALMQSRPDIDAIFAFDRQA